VRIKGTGISVGYKLQQGIDAFHSAYVGDGKSDIMTAANAGIMNGFLVTRERQLSFMPETN